MSDLPTEPGSVIQLDSLLMRTRFGNWVSDGGFIVTDDDLAADTARGPAYAPTVIFDAALPEGIPWASTQVTVTDEMVEAAYAAWRAHGWPQNTQNMLRVALEGALAVGAASADVLPEEEQ